MCQKRMFLIHNNERMIDMLLGYARVSTLEQNLDRQIDALVNAGMDPRMIYQEKITGTKLQRPELNRLLEDLQPGDILIIPDLTRISRSIKDLLMIVEKVREKKASIKSLKDTWLDTHFDCVKFFV